jgi:hypothetical protein
MIATLIAFVVLAQTGGQVSPPPPSGAEQPTASPPDPAKIVSAMLAHYFHADSMSGKILLTTTADGARGQLLTTLQFKSPAFVYIRQDMAAATQRSWLIICDGTDFEYPVPQGMIGSAQGRILSESLSVSQGITSFRDVYKIGGQGLKDRSAPLEMAFSVSDELRALRREWVTMRYAGQTQLRGETCDVIEGYWSESGKAPEASYRMTIGPDKDLRRYEIFGKLSLSEGRKQVIGPVDVKEVWDVDLKVNGPVDESLFHL